MEAERFSLVKLKSQRRNKTSVAKTCLRMFTATLRLDFNYHTCVYFSHGTLSLRYHDLAKSAVR